MSKKVIVSGASGQDGSYMVEYLLKNTDNTVIVALRRTSQAILSNLGTVLSNPRVKMVTMDLNDVHSITQLMRNEKPDYFINFGASAYVPDSWNSPAQVMSTNAISLIHILEAVRQYAPSCRVYSAGSSEQWGDVKYSPQDEKHPPSPRSIYGVSKVAAGFICKVYRESYGTYAVHGVLLNHESERRQAYYLTRKCTLGVARIAHAIKNNEPFEPLELGNIDAKRDWSHAEDFVDGIWRMLNQEVRKDGNFQDSQPGIITSETFQWPKEYVLSSGETHTVREFVEKAFAVAGIKGVWWNSRHGDDPLYDEYLLSTDGFLATKAYTPLVKVNPVFFRPADVELLLGDSTRARTELGWSPKVGFNELVERMVRHDLETYGK